MNSVELDIATRLSEEQQGAEQSMFVILIGQRWVVSSVGTWYRYGPLSVANVV